MIKILLIIASAMLFIRCSTTSTQLEKDLRDMERVKNMECSEKLCTFGGLDK